MIDFEFIELKCALIQNNIDQLNRDIQILDVTMVKSNFRMITLGEPVAKSQHLGIGHRPQACRWAQRGQSTWLMGQSGPWEPLAACWGRPS